MTLTLLNNRYRIIQALGAGGFGNTFLAEDTHLPSSRRCVIKQLKPVTHDPQAYELAQQRFQREAAVLEDLGEGSNQIPRLFAYFTEADQFYLVQEWIEGDTLTKKVEQQGALSETAVREILVSILPVLEYVHSRRMVHRDIKPDNIIVRKQDGKPVLIDFGAVKEAMGSVVQSIAIGTPGFMPSEQAAGQPMYASDIYSLALTAVYLLTGKKPQEMQINPSTGEIIWRQSAPNISASFANILDKAMRSHPRDRFATAREMLNALQSSTAVPYAGTATQATLAVAPGATPPPAPASSTQNVPIIAIPASQREKNPWLIGGLVAGGFAVAAIAISSLLNRSSPPSPQASSSSPSTTQQQSTQEQTRSQTGSSSPSERSPTIPPAVIAESPLPNPEPSGIPSSSPLEGSQNTPTPVISASPSPVATRSPLSTPENNNNQNSSTTVPAFPTGTSRGDVEAAIGKPAKESRGYWGTRAVTYNFVPKQIDLGYLYDRNTGQIRQTEVSFDQSVQPQVMLTTLDGLLQGNAPDELKQGLRRVQERRANSFTYTQGSLKIQIVRQDCDFIYISIWDADLHDFDVSSAKQC